ncbi:hypothetical protein Q5752_006783 [Cryptotrichosporon argae]
MEDPWAAGPSWSAAPGVLKPAVPSLALAEPPRAPTPELDVADPWGVPSAAVPPPAMPSPPPSPPKATYGGWGDEAEPWGASAPAPAPALAPTDDIAQDATPTEAAVATDSPASPFSPAASPDGAVWSLDSPKLDGAAVPLPRSPSPALATLSTLPTLASAASLASLGAASPSRPRSPDAAHLPKSPSFGSDFGGFATVGDVGDPWGGEDAWGARASSSRPSSGFGAADPSLGHSEDDEDGWGGATSRAPGYSSPKGEDDWETQQRKMRARQARAPQERVDALKQGWKEVATDVIGLANKMIAHTEDEERVLESGVRKLDDEVTDKLRSLASLPPNVNTYPVPLLTLTTYKTYQTALSRPANPSTSLLTLPTVRRRTDDGLAFDLPDYSWAGRSRLGEPDAVQEVVLAEEQSSRWGFWGRKSATPKQLVTSGGGQLEVKPAAPTPLVSPMNLATDKRASVSVSMSHSASRAPSVSSIQHSRATTPAPAPALTSPHAGQPRESFEDVGHPTHDHPSAVSRFFGRFSRRASQRAPDGHGHDADLELSADDLSYLDQVPSIAGVSMPAAGAVDDLLALDPAHKAACSLDAVLAPAPRQATPIAPPSRPSAGSSARQPSAGFAPRMKAPERPQSTSFDLLSGLDFDAPAASTSSPPATSPASQATGSPMWDDFLAPSAARPTLASASRPALTSAPAPSSLPRPAPLSNAFTSQIHPAPNSAGPALAADHADDFGDFGGFGASTSASADFGDFSAFGGSHAFAPAPTAAPLAQPAPAPAHAPAFAPSQTIKPVLDHTATLHLVSDASTSRGRRWPAPESPIPPPLEPPPNASGSAAFPFFPPPPPGRASSATPSLDLLGAGAATSGNASNGFGGLGGLAGLGLGDAAQSRAGPGSGMGASMGGTLQASLAPARAASRLANVQGLQPTASAAMGKGLSAQDLSFFDSL